MKFDYFIVFSSIILGLGLGNIYNGIGGYLKVSRRYPKRIKHSSTLSVWGVVMIIVSFQFFASSCELSGELVSDKYLFMVNLAITSFIFIITRIITPDFNAPDVSGNLSHSKNEIYDLNDFFDRNRSILMSCGIIIILLSAAYHCLIYSNLKELTWENNLIKIIDSYKAKRLYSHLIFIILLLFAGLMKRPIKPKRFYTEQIFWRIQFFISVTAFILICKLVNDAL